MIIFVLVRLTFSVVPVHNFITVIITVLSFISIINHSMTVSVKFIYSRWNTPRTCIFPQWISLAILVVLSKCIDDWLDAKKECEYLLFGLGRFSLIIDHQEPQELDLSPTVARASEFVATVGLLLTPDFGMIEPMLEHDSLVATTLFWFVHMTVLGKHGVPQELDLSPSNFKIWCNCRTVVDTRLWNDWTHSRAWFICSNNLVLICMHDIAWQTWCTPRTWLVSHSSDFRICCKCRTAVDTRFQNDWTYIGSWFICSNNLVLICMHDIAWQTWCTPRTWLVPNSTNFGICCNHRIAVDS